MSTTTILKGVMAKKIIFKEGNFKFTCDKSLSGNGFQFFLNTRVQDTVVKKPKKLPAIELFLIKKDVRF